MPNSCGVCHIITLPRWGQSRDSPCLLEGFPACLPVIIAMYAHRCLLAGKWFYSDFHALIMLFIWFSCWWQWYSNVSVGLSRTQVVQCIDCNFSQCWSHIILVYEITIIVWYVGSQQKVYTKKITLLLPTQAMTVDLHRSDLFGYVLAWCLFNIFRLASLGFHGVFSF